NIGTSNNQFIYPQGIAFDSSSGTLYVADTGNHRVMQYSPNALSGNVVAGGNGAGNGNTELANPTGIYFDSSSNSLIIANTGANNIVRWVLGDTNWTLIAGDINGVSGNTSTLLHEPYDVTLDSWGNVYVADTYNNRIQFFLAGHSNGTAIAGDTNVYRSNSTLLSCPYSLVLDAQLNLYVSDSLNFRIQKFAHY
ncbi:unnamed protein product, partial [Rotaria sp. Silwood2]